MRILIATPLYPPEVGGPATYTKLLEEAVKVKKSKEKVKKKVKGTGTISSNFLPC